MNQIPNINHIANGEDRLLVHNGEVIPNIECKYCHGHDCPECDALPNIEETNNTEKEENWHTEYKAEFGWSDNYWLDDSQIEFFTKQLQKARAEGYEQGYTQGKFDEKMDAEYKHPEELQKAREEVLPYLKAYKQILDCDWSLNPVQATTLEYRSPESVLRNQADEIERKRTRAGELAKLIDLYQAELDQDKK